MSDHQDLILRACSGDSHAFEALIVEHGPRLRGVLKRMVGHPDDVEDLFQDTLSRAWEGIDSFRGTAKFSTWLCTIGTRVALDHLRRQKRWRPEAQIVYSNECVESEEWQNEVIAAIADPEFAFEAKEHIAYCFSCVGRSLEPDQQTALVLREVLGMKNREAAEMLGISESIFRHRLAAARSIMKGVFEGMCSLVNKEGVCYQCQGLRGLAPANRQGSEVPTIANLDDRIEWVQSAPVTHCRMQPMHEVFWRRTCELEQRGGGSTIPRSTCGRPTDS